MPLLLCPNDDGAMQTVQRSGVEFDICPTCRGVWLDRGELEKLLAMAREDDPEALGLDRAPPPHRSYDSHPPRRPAGRRDWGDDDDYRHKKRRSSIFDIFD